MKVDVDAERLVVDSDDINDEGNYEVIVTAKTPDAYTYKAVSASTKLALDAVFDCK